MKTNSTLNYQDGIQNSTSMNYHALTQPLSPYQHKLYKKALYGLAEYTKEEQRSLTKLQRDLITLQQRSLWRELNVWKNEIINAPVKNWLKNLFKRSPLMQSFMEYPETDSPVKKTFTQMGIPDRAIALKAVELGFLPKDFFERNYAA